MTASPAPRRSRRLLAKTDTASASVTKPSLRPSKSSSSTTKIKYLNTWLRNASSSSASSVDLNLIGSKLATKHDSRSCKLNPETSIKCSVAHFIADSASTSDCSTDSETSDEEDSDDEYEELTDLSTDNFEWVVADNVVATRNHSYDSRFEPGNVEYEMDEFVVGDDEVEQWSEAGEEDAQSDIYKKLIDIERRPSEYLIDTRRSSNESGSHHPAPPNTIDSRRSSEESKLFFSDPNDKSDPLNTTSWSELDSLCGYMGSEEEPLHAEANSYVVEEIVDATALFSRRCNRGRKPIRLRLALGVLQDREVKEALDSAMRLGLARKFPLEDGSQRWTIGPKIV